MEEVPSFCTWLTPPFCPSMIWVLFSPTFPGTFPCSSYHLLFHIFILSPWGSFLTATDMCKPFLKTNWQKKHKKTKKTKQQQKKNKLTKEPPYSCPIPLQLSPSTYIHNQIFFLIIVDPQYCASSRCTAKWLRDGLIDSFSDSVHYRLLQDDTVPYFVHHTIGLYCPSILY